MKVLLASFGIFQQVGIIMENVYFRGTRGTIFTSHLHYYFCLIGNVSSYSILRTPNGQTDVGAKMLRYLGLCLHRQQAKPRTAVKLGTQDRAIPCDRWQTCFQHLLTNFTSHRSHGDTLYRSWQFITLALWFSHHVSLIIFAHVTLYIFIRCTDT